MGQISRCRVWQLRVREGVGEPRQGVAGTTVGAHAVEAEGRVADILCVGH
ncbi:MAG: hypothetical protein ABIQ16_22405 [Polyangiaceae bacterium]